MGSGMAEVRAGMAKTACARMENFILMDLRKVVDLFLDCLRVGIEMEERNAFFGTMLLLYSNPSARLCLNLWLLASNVATLQRTLEVKGEADHERLDQIHTFYLILEFPQ